MVDVLHSVTESLYDLMQWDSNTKNDRAAHIIGYLPGCYPDRTTYQQAVRLVRESGIRVLEIGIPGAIGSLEGGVISDALRSVEEAYSSIRDVIVDSSKDVVEGGLVPIVMAFRGTVFDQVGYKGFLDSVIEGGASLLLVPDIVEKEIEELSSYAGNLGVRLIPFASAMDETPSLGDGAPFVYLQTANIPTGGDFSPSQDLQRRIHQHGLSNPETPTGVGFGIRTAEDVTRVHALGADFAIVGTAMVEALNGGLHAFSHYLETLTHGEDWS